MQKDRNTAVPVLFTVALLQVFSGALYGLFYGNWTDFSMTDRLFVFCAPVYVALGLVGRRYPLTALSIGWLFVCFLRLDLDSRRESFNFLKDGQSFQILIFVLLGWGIYHEDRRRKRTPPAGKN
jgi:hypothetical protein